MIHGSRSLSRRWALRRLGVAILALASTVGAKLSDDGGAVSTAALRGHVFFLGDDALQGRAPGTPGAAEAARYISGELEGAGLKPLGRGGGWLQDVPLHGTSPVEDDTELVLTVGGASTPLHLGDDYLLFTGGVQTLIPREVPLVFAGYGIVAPEFDYNDYQGLDVAGKVVIVLTGEPESSDPDYFGGSEPTVYSTAEAKQRTALSRGARGSLLIPSSLEPPRRWEDLQQDFAFEHLSLPYSLPRHLSAWIHPRRAPLLFQGVPWDLEAVHRMEASHTLRSFPLAARVRFRGEFRERDFFCSNVAGLLPGGDPALRDTYVLVSAHYDHLGVGPPRNGDVVYNGVIDNAIGVAGVLEMARVLAARPRPPARSIVFLFPTAEEEGLLGSLYYLDHPLVPVHRTVANLNVDGLAHVDTFADVVGIGAEQSTLGEALARVAARRGLEVSEMPPMARADAFTFSDQAAFAEVGVPALLVNEGLRWSHHTPREALELFAEWGRTRYHQPSDDLGQTLDFEATRQHVEVLVDLVLEIANDPEPPRWNPGQPGALAQLRTRAEGR
jgi:hypothetical protein